MGLEAILNAWENIAGALKAHEIRNYLSISEIQ